MKRVQFNVRIAEDVAELLRLESTERGIGPGKLLEDLATNYLSETRAGLWVELTDGLEAGLAAVAAARHTSSAELLQQIVGTSLQNMLMQIAARTPSVDPIDFEEDGPDPDDFWDDVSEASVRTARRAADNSELPRGERRKRPRRVPLTSGEREELASAPADLPRTGADLRTWRTGRKLSADALGKACGVSRVAVGLWEQKGALPGPILLKLLRGIADLP